MKKSVWYAFVFLFLLSRLIDSGKAVQNYLADANSVTGICVDYDKISFSLGLKSNADNVAIKGRTTYKNFNFSFGGNKWIAEASYRYYKGFYDKNTALYDTSYRAGKPYYQDPSMRVQQTKAKFLYFKNHRNFSYRAAYGNTYRQLKSSVTFILGGNIYSNKMSTDTSFFPKQVREFYYADDSLRRLNVVGVSGGGGAGVNIVFFKRFFANLIFTLYAEPQWRYYDRINAPSGTLCYLSASGDARFAIAYNAENFFISFNTFSDFVAVNSTALTISSKFISGSFNIGYRFKVKTPKLYAKFQETKFYKML